MGRAKWFGIVVVAFLLPLSFVASLGLMFMSQKPPPEAFCGPNESSTDAPLDIEELGLQQDQIHIITTAVEVIRSRSGDFPGDDALKAGRILFATGYVESGIHNLNRGDRDSKGWLQQRPSQGWGTIEQVMNVAHATNSFLTALLGVENWRTMPEGDAAQAVQRSAYPDKYAEYLDEAITIVGAYMGNGSVVAPDACLMNLIVEAELAEVGNPYPAAQPADGASFHSSTFEEFGLQLPDTLAGQFAFRGNDAAGIRATWKSADDILAGNAPLEYGDEVFLADEAGASEPSTSGLFVSSGSEGSILVASANVLGSSHTPQNGPRSGPNRVRTMAELIKGRGFAVVGMQEVQRNQIAPLMGTLGPSWDYWPRPPHFSDKGKLPHSNNMIIWDTTKVTFVKGTSLPMPLYFGGKRNIPLVHFEDNASGQPFDVINTHDPAHGWNKRKRLKAAKQHAADADRLVDAGHTVFFTGDYNSGTRLRDNGNRTAGNNRANLTWCVMTRSGNMLNGYDAAQSPPRTGECPRKTSREPQSDKIDHVYVSSDLQVSDYQAITDRRLTASDHPVVYVEASTALMRQSASSNQTGGIGTYVGPDPETGEISLLSVNPKLLLGALHFTFSSPVTAGGLNGPIMVGNATLPIAKPYRLTNYFGQKKSYYASGYHTGQDFAAPAGTPLYAVADGEIVFAAYEGAYGNKTILRLADGSEFWYCHQAGFEVTSGRVKAGQVIGYVGETGNAYGAHLHLEYHPSQLSPAIDPMPILRLLGLDP